MSSISAFARDLPGVCSAWLCETAAAWRSRASGLAFRPDVVVAPDPLAPDARLVARGIAGAMRVCAREGRALKVLLGRVPGCEVTVSMLSASCTAKVAIESCPDGGGQSRAPAVASVAVPAFSLGIRKSVWRISGDDFRLFMSPPMAGDLRVRISLPPA